MTRGGAVGVGAGRHAGPITGSQFGFPIQANQAIYLPLVDEVDELVRDSTRLGRITY